MKYRHEDRAEKLIEHTFLQLPAAVIGFVMVGCGEKDSGGGSFDSALKGDWDGGDSGILKISADKWEGSPENSNAAYVAGVIKTVKDAEAASSSVASVSLNIGKGKIIVSYSVQGNSEEEEYFTYEIKDNTLTLTYGADFDADTGEAFVGKKK